MSTELHERLNQIRSLRGREPIDGTRIQDDGGAVTPWPQFSERATVRVPGEVGEPEAYDDTPPLPPASPLIPRTAPDQNPPPPPRPTPAVPIMPNVSLIVVDGNAAYLGHEAQLTESEQNAVATIVLRAGERAIREKLDRVVSKRGPRRKPAPAEIVPSVSAPPEPRQRVRRKTVLKP